MRPGSHGTVIRLVMLVATLCAGCTGGVAGGDADADADQDDAGSDGDVDGDADGDEASDADEPGCPEPPGDVIRVAGATRYETAAALSAAIYTDAPHVVIANGEADVTIDALVGAPLGTALDGPVLIVPAGSVPPEVCAEIGRLGAENAHVVGGPAVINESVLAALRDCGIVSVDRFNGADASDTSARTALAVEMSGRSGRAVIGPIEGGTAPCRYLGPASALAAGIGDPLLVVPRDTVPDTVTNTLDALDVESTVVVGPPEVISDTAFGALPGAERLDADDPAGAAAAVASRVRSGRSGRFRVLLSWVSDAALAPEAGTAAATDEVVLLTERGQPNLPEPAATFLATHRCDVDGVVIVGGEDVIPADVEAEVRGLLAPAHARGAEITSVSAAPSVLDTGDTVTVTVSVRGRDSGAVEDAEVVVEAVSPSGARSTTRTGGVNIAERTTTDVVQDHGPLATVGVWTFQASLLDSSGAVLHDGPSDTVVVREPGPDGGLGAWAWGTTVSEMGAAAFADDVAASGIQDVFLLVKGVSGTFRLGTLDEVVAARDAAGYRFRVHAWVICFNDSSVGSWIDPASASYRSYLLDDVLTPLLRDHEPDGVNLDYVRYPGTAAGRTEPITSFVMEVRALIDRLRPGALLTAAVMPEMEANAETYGQDYAALAGPVDALLPMAYTTNYGQSVDWVRRVTSYVLAQAGGACDVWPALQSFDDEGRQMSADRLRAEIQAARDGGATGVSLFRYPHTVEQVEVAREFTW